MRAYLVISGLLFALVVTAHLLRILVDGIQLVTDPWWVLMTVIAAFLSAWAWRLVWHSRDQGA